MSDDVMPERITLRDERHRPVEFIRADALRTKLGGYHDSDLLSLAESLWTFHDNYEATMEKMQVLLAEREQDLRDTTKQIEYERVQHAAELAERDAKIAELKSTMERLLKQLHAANARIDELEYELLTCKRNLIDRVSVHLMPPPEVDVVLQLHAANARIAELETEQRDLCADVVFHFSEYAVYGEDEQAVIDKAREILCQLPPPLVTKGQPE